MIRLGTTIAVSNKKGAFRIDLHMKPHPGPIVHDIHLETVELDHMLCQKFKFYPAYLCIEIPDHSAKLTTGNFSTGDPEMNLIAPGLTAYARRR
jgi:hypothetical protein